MFKKTLAAGALMVAGITNVSAVPYGFFDARSVAMGNVSVATGGVQTAAFANPAMLAVNEGDSTLAMLLPAFGVQVVDDGNVVDLVDEFQDLENGTPSVASLARQYQIVTELTSSGATITANAALNAALIYSGETFTLAGHYRGFGTATGAIVNFNNNPLNPDADLSVFGYTAQEIGVSVATKLDLAGLEIAVGVRPKNVSLEAIDFQESISTIDTAEIADDSVEDLGSFTSMDAGIAISIFDSFTVGLVATNILDETKTTTGATPIDFETHMRAGIAYHNGFITIAADMDLDEIEPTLYEDKSQMMAVGVELNALDFMQIRAGYQTNMASGASEPDLISAGLGFWFGFHLDVAVVAGEDSSLGAFVQTGFRF